MELVLTGIGQEVSLSNMRETNNFLLFKRSDGSPLRVHVPEESIKELLSSLKSDTAPPQQYEPVPEAPEEAATEFGGDVGESEAGEQGSSFLLEQDDGVGADEEPTDEDDVPSL
jgi:hypothetical protein